MLKPENTERVLSITALITAVVAVMLGVIESQRSHEHRQISVEPYLLLANSQQRGGYQFVVVNQGLGPARLERVTVTVNDKPIKSWSQATATLLDPAMHAAAETQSGHSTLSTGRMISSGETVEALTIRDPDVALTFAGQMRSGAVEVELCYCSMYDQCWVSGYNLGLVHTPAKRCRTDDEPPSVFPAS